LSSYNVVQFITLLIYFILILIVLRNRPDRIKRYFLVYLVAALGWSMTSYMGNSDLPANQALGWSKWTALTASWSIIAYAHFIACYLNKRAGLVAIVGYLYVAIIGLLIGLGYVHQNFSPENQVLSTDYGYWLYLLTIGGAVFMVYAIVALIKSYRKSGNPEHRNKIAYLLTGIGCLVIFGILWEVAPRLNYSVDHIGHMLNALIISYATLKYKLLDIRLVLKKGLVYGTVTVAITACLLFLLLNVSSILRDLNPSSNIAITIITVVSLAVIFHPLRSGLEKVTDRVFYGKRYDYRKMVYSFASRMKSVIELNELAKAMLQPLVKAVGASQASLLFLSNGYFTAKYSEHMKTGAPTTPISFRHDGPIVKWLEKEDSPLSRDDIDTKPNFKGLWQEERDTLNAANIDLLLPIKSKQSLISILAVSKKHRRGYYNRDDIDMLMTMANEAAMVIENASLYAKAKERANTDELTGLFNHRYFHQRLDEEIARASRFGEVFSLLLVDMDLFKTYNDVYGHLAGDEILKQMGKITKESVRDSDICFRYGGDEFAVILPKTSSQDAREAAERIRKEVETQLDHQGLPLSCSIGISTWPTDGVIREELIQSSDSALYYAKRTGKNHSYSASEVALSEVLRMESSLNPDSSSAVLNTIYALAATVDAKDHYTYGHAKNVAKHAMAIAEALNYTKEDIERIRAASLLHDIGKIGIADRVLQKSEALTPNEWDLIRTHPDLGVSIIKHIDSLKDCLAAVQYHHERHDGTGYPTGLKGENIPLDARILAVADAYDAMVSQRPYRERAFTHEEAMDELIRCAGTQFDPEIVKVFVNINAPAPRKATRSKKVPAEKPILTGRPSKEA